MSKSNIHENDYLKLMFNNVSMPLIGDAAGVLASTVAGSLFFSLHTADPGEAGDQTTTEIAYTGYARVAFARSVGGFTVSTNTVATVANVNFPAGTGGTGTAAFWGLGTAATLGGKLLYKGAMSPSIVCGNGVTPVLTAGVVVTED